MSPTVVVPGGDRRDRGDLLLGLDVLGQAEQLLGDDLDGLLDAALETHRVRTGGHVAQALADHRLGEDRGGRRTVTGDVVGLLGDLLDELRTDLLVGVLELDLLGDAHTVVGDRGGAPLLLQHDVAALGTEGHLDGVGEGVHAPLEAAPGLLVESNQLRHMFLRFLTLRMSLGFVTLMLRVPASCLALAPRECKRGPSVEVPAEGQASDQQRRPGPGASDSTPWSSRRRRGPSQAATRRPVPPAMSWPPTALVAQVEPSATASSHASGLVGRGRPTMVRASVAATTTTPAYQTQCPTYSSHRWAVSPGSTFQTELAARWIPCPARRARTRPRSRTYVAGRPALQQGEQRRDEHQ